jgi:hypothetical protein
MKIVILFGYYLPINQGLTATNFNNFKLHNPGCEVVPLNMDTVAIPDRFSHIKSSEPWHHPRGRAWWFSDLLPHFWFLSHKPVFDKVFFFDYDCFCNVALEGYFDYLFKSNNPACAHLYDKNWAGYGHHYPAAEHAAKYENFFAGACGGIMHTHESLKKTTDIIMSEPLLLNLPHEVRTGIAGRMAGFTWQSYRPDQAARITFGPVRPSTPGVWHIA